MAERPKISILFQKATEMQAKVDAIQPLLQPAEFFNQILSSKVILSVNNLIKHSIDLSDLFEINNKLDQYYDDKYLNTLSNLFPELTDQDEIKVSTFDLVEQANEDPAQRIILLNEVPKAQQLICSVYNDHQRLYQLHPRDFEEMIAELMRKQGWEVKLTKQTRDQGVDIVALQYLGDSPYKAVIECKRHALNRKVGVGILRGFQSVIVTQQANKGIIFTSSYFSADAKQYQQQHLPYLLELKDYDDIIDWITSERT
jgi:HJR/Mrr/RecB family endonuclease